MLRGCEFIASSNVNPFRDFHIYISDDAFFNQNWAEAFLITLGRSWDCRWVGPLALDVGLLCKNKKERGSAGARPLLLRCLSRFLPDERKDQLLRGRMFLRTFHRWGGLVFIAYVFPNWMVVRIFSHWMEDFLPLSLSN